MISVLKNKLSKKGFTLAELLVVVAIIAVLVAIAIPTFSSATKKANLAVDDSNIRSAYALLRVAQLTGSLDVDDAVVTPTADGKYYYSDDGSLSASDTNGYKLRETEAGCKAVPGGSYTHTKNNYIIITYTASSKTWALTSSAS